MSQCCASVHVLEFEVGPHAITPKTKEMISVRMVKGRVPYQGAFTQSAKHDRTSRAMRLVVRRWSYPVLTEKSRTETICFVSRSARNDRPDPIRPSNASKYQTSSVHRG